MPYPDRWDWGGTELRSRADRNIDSVELIKR